MLILIIYAVVAAVVFAGLNKKFGLGVKKDYFGNPTNENFAPIFAFSALWSVAIPAALAYYLFLYLPYKYTNKLLDKYFKS